MICPRSKLVAVLRLTYEEAAEAADQSLLPGQGRAVRAHRLLRALAERLRPLRLQLASTTASKSDDKSRAYYFHQQPCCRCCLGEREGGATSAMKGLTYRVSFSPQEGAWPPPSSWHPQSTVTQISAPRCWVTLDAGAARRRSAPRSCRAKRNRQRSGGQAAIPPHDIDEAC